VLSSRQGLADALRKAAPPFLWPRRRSCRKCLLTCPCRKCLLTCPWVDWHHDSCAPGRWLTDCWTAGTVVDFGVGDYAWMFLAVLILFLPGGLVLIAAGWASRRRVAVGVAIAPLVSIAICYLTGIATGLLGLRYGLLAVGVVTVLLVAAAFGVRLVHPVEVRRQAAHRRSLREVPLRWWSDVASGMALVIVAFAVSVRTWARGMNGSLGIVPQEHDMITHTLLTAHIARSGHAAPWNAWTVDLLSGTPSSFYPSGFHGVAALVVDAGTDPVTAVNATMLAVLALCLPLGLLALASQVRHVRLPYIVGGIAAVVSTMAYRPTYAFFHDGGLLANDMAISLSPAALAGFLALRDRALAPGAAPTMKERSWWLDVVLVAAVAIGAFAVHPTSAAIIGVSVVGWFLGELVHRTQRRLLWWRLLKLGAGVVLAGVLALPILRAGGSSVGTVAAWPRDVPIQPFPHAVGVTLGMPYRGFLDVTNQHSQTLFAILALVGVAAVLVTRRGFALLAVWAAWSVVLVAFLVGAAVPGLSTVTGFFYNDYRRISGVLGPLQWLMIGIGLTTVAAAILRGVESLTRVVDRGGLPTRVTAAMAAVIALVLGLLLVAVTAGYRNTNGSAMAGRYAQSDFTRVDGNDRAAFAWLDKHVRPGERVMNNANDGSTYLYVYDGIPVVNVSSLGSVPYTDELLANFNGLDTDQRVQQLIRKLDIRWVYIDTQAPTIGVAESIYPWYKGGSIYTIAPGMTGLDEVSGLSRRFTSGSVSVYEVAPSFLTAEANGSQP